MAQLAFKLNVFCRTSRPDKSLATITCKVKFWLQLNSLCWLTRLLHGKLALYGAS